MPYPSLRILICPLFLVSYTGDIATAQSDSICHTIIDAFLAKAGGKEKISQLKTSRFVFQTHAKNDTATITIIKVAGEKYYEHYSHGDYKQSLSYADGKLIEKVDNRVSRIKDPLRIERIVLQSFILPELAYETLGYTLKYRGVENLDGKEFHHVLIESPLGFVTDLHYEKSSGYLRMVTDKDGSRASFPSYEHHLGMMVPNYLDMEPANGSRARYYLKDIAFDEAIDASLFNLK